MPVQVGPGCALDTFIFERPMGRRHFFRSDGDSGVAVTAGSCEIQLEGVDLGLMKKIFDADSFTVDDIRGWYPDLPMTEVAELLTELVRSGLLVARLTPGPSSL
jgi:hypothetical protein